MRVVNRVISIQGCVKSALQGSGTTDVTENVRQIANTNVTVIPETASPAIPDFGDTGALLSVWVKTVPNAPEFPVRVRSVSRDFTVHFVKRIVYQTCVKNVIKDLDFATCAG